MSLFLSVGVIFFSKISTPQPASDFEVLAAHQHISDSCRQKGCWFAFQPAGRLESSLWEGETHLEKASFSMGGASAVFP